MLRPVTVNLRVPLFALCLIVFAGLSLVSAQTAGEYAAMLERAQELHQKQKYTEALPILEKLANADANNALVQYLYGFSLIGEANSTKDEEAERQLRVKARIALMKSQSLGRKDYLVDAILSTMSPDGKVTGKFSQNFQAEYAMREAEGFFSQGKFDDAFAMYQKALSFDPKIYEALLYSGDVFTQQAKYDQAEIWYQKAIVLNPMIETAYRYSATPYMRQKKYDVARDRYIEAFIVEPYSRFSVLGISQWAEATGAKLGHPRIDIPASVGKGSNGNIQINLGAGGEDDGSFAWTAYSISRAAWQMGGELSDKFKTAYPAERKYRHSLAEEAEALKIAVSTLKARMAEKNNPVKNLDPQLANLIKLYDEGLIEAFVLMAMPDEGIAADHPAYLKQNRDKLRFYVAKYVIRL